MSLPIISQAEYLRATTASEPHHIIKSFAQRFHINTAEELLGALSTALQDIRGEENEEVNKRVAHWGQEIKTTKFKKMVTKYFDNRVTAATLCTNSSETTLIPMATTLDLCFAIIGEPETTQPFMTGISSNLNTDTLKKTIYDFKKGLLKNVKDPSSLVLYRTCLPSSDYTSDKEFSEDDTKPQNVMTGSISRYFQDGAEEDKIHIVVKRPK
ncbi:hypothetical protein BGX27_010909, partial [Mortierella sp. AM989]